ncbi:1f46fd72-66f2-4bf3-81e6-fcd51f652c19-CDS [Sclerotinia trifoliorum]|uniref:1f46fd72-66f2-4bf3-81e6-fcd51f652c19-CDS n=1 Tax=Sclerotinia trifoliorum TaxID=28548 RepID=A0A8H2VVQ0_9HELO|nr:1f46fd72-66f2-4bf3-81e6-fcd51f652c19-CDS [Sclerotinia trifoliorum]
MSESINGSSSKPPSAQNRPIHGRQRARKACIPCRQRKRRCDVEFPCSMCSRYGYNCRYTDERSPTIPNLPPVRSILPGLTEMQHGFASSTTNPTDGRQSIANTQPSSISSQNVVEQGILDPLKSRYMSQHSAVAFPRSLGVEFQSANPPPLHSFAWNCGIRAEEAASAHTNLTRLVSFDEFKRYSDIYMVTVHPPFGFLDWPYFMKRCNDYWSNQGRDLTFGAVVGGVIALGSFFAFRLGHPRELEIVQHVKTVLEDPTLSRHPSIDQINAWILRTLYLRSTTRPHVAWLASCITLHLAEATGLHQEVHLVLLATEGDTQAKGLDEAEVERARKTFWMAWSVHTIISYEYGRSAVILNSITCKPINDIVGDSTAIHIKIAELIPRDNMIISSETHKEELMTALKGLAQMQVEHPFLSLSKGDVCFCFYRRLRIMKHVLEKEAIQCIIEIGNKAAEAADTFARNGHPWWNILSTTFQYFCVLLAIDTSESLSNVSWVLSILENIVRIVNTHLAVEAFDTAKVLLRDSMAKKRRDLGFLETADGQHGPEVERLVDINWDALLDPTFPDALMSEEFSIYNT